jgi:hypothetical protein
MRRNSMRTALTTAVIVVCMALAPVAHAELTIEPGSFTVATTSTLAGAHPDLTTSFAFLKDSGGSTEGNLRNLEVDLPVGFAGYATAMPTCTQAQLLTGHFGSCPVDSQVGTVALTLNAFGSPVALTLPVYNMVPAPGQTAMVGFIVSGIITSNIVISVRPGDYGLRATLTNLLGNLEVDSSSLTLWGVPADASHDPQRGQICTPGGCAGGEHSAGVAPASYLRNPSQCSGVQLSATLRVESWQSPTRTQGAESTFGPVTGCEHLGFAPTISLQPGVAEAGAPSEYTVTLKLPQNGDPQGLATADLRRAVVTLPQGVVLSPSAAAGLQACTDTQAGIGTSAPVACPDASKIGEATVTTPALADKLTGAVYLAGPASGPITGPPYRIFLTLAGDGVSLKLVGTVQPDPSTGQLTTTFDNSPQLPFSELTLKLKGGPRAPLANPATCGQFTTTTDLTPWSSPFAADATPLGTFEISGCSGPRFLPSFSAGTVNNQAGGFSPFTLTLSRSDRDEDLREVSIQTPPGLLGMLSSVSPCPEPQASVGTCGPDSLIGRTTVAAGRGSDPIYVSGDVFLTGSYRGAPFGLSIVVPEVAGPFNLGREIVRAQVRIDPHTAQLTVTSDPLPSILGGIPLHIRTVHVTVDRPGFMFNPTNCEPLSVAGGITSTAATTVAVSSRFQAANCATLPFNPNFTALTQASTSKANGVYLHVKVVSRPGQANIGKVKVDLPKQLPSRLTTLQKACPDGTFNANPASCPPASLVGTATAVTPVLKSPLTGPAYLVSHAGAAFPDLVIVLQGEGITLDLIGNTDIKNGVTISTFNTVPDAPISTFDLVLPQGPHSALGANLPQRAKSSLCRQSLAMPTAITGQNGAVIRQTTRIAVSGCPRRRARKAKHTQKSTHKR